MPIIILMLASTALAQLSPEEAQARLDAQLAQERQAAAQQEALDAMPSNLTIGQVNALNREIARQANIIADLQRQLAAKATSRPTIIRPPDRAAVGQTIEQLKSIPNSMLHLLSEDIKEQHYIIEIGKITVYRNDAVQGFNKPTGRGVNSGLNVGGTVSVAIGYKPELTQQVVFDVVTGKVSSVDVKPNNTTLY